MSKLAVAACVVGGLMIIGTVSGGDDGGSGGDSYGAEDSCKEWVKDKLKAPSTADFSDVKVDGPDSGPWVVTGQVDAENGFGAMLRTGWLCDVRLEGDYYKGSAALLEF